MIEFSEDLSKRYTGLEAMAKRAFFRLAPERGEIPYFNGGLEKELFKSEPQDLIGNIRMLLSDFQVSVRVESGRVVVGEIQLDIPGAGG
jgi:hypothetical protein